MQMMKLKGEAEKKDAIILNSNRKISALEDNIAKYQEEFR